MQTQQYFVPGVSCEHCVRAVTEEVSALADVVQVDVNLSNKIVTVDHNENLSSDQIIAAIHEAGYEEVTLVR
jgi:copper chaperone